MDAASSIAKLGLNARDAFGSMDEVIAFQELINKQFIIGGASVQEQQAAMIQLTQAMASGVLRGEELNSVPGAAPLKMLTTTTPSKGGRSSKSTTPLWLGIRWLWPEFKRARNSWCWIGLRRTRP